MGTLASPLPYIPLPAPTSHKPRETRGDNAFARCAVAPIPSFMTASPPVAVKHEDGAELGMLGLGRPEQVPDTYIKLEPLEEGEVWDSTCSMSPSTLFLGSIRPSTADHYSSTHLPPRPFADHKHASPYSQTYSRAFSASTSGDNDHIPGLDQHDMLDRTIGIKPRDKRSNELQTILSPEWQNKIGKQDALPDRMQRITQQFMVANHFVVQRAYIERSKRKPLWNSLLLRLDLHGQSNSNGVGHIRPEWLRKCLAVGVETVNKFILAESKRWKGMGIIQPQSELSTPKFHTCTRDWKTPAWSGQTSTDGSRIDAILSDLSSLNKADLRTVLDHVHIEPANKGELPQSVYFSRDATKGLRRPLGQLTSSAVNIFGKFPRGHGRDNAALEELYVPGSALAGPKAVYTDTDKQELHTITVPHPKAKRSADDDLRPLPFKRPRIEPMSHFLPVENRATLDHLVCSEKEFVRIIDSIHLAHGLLTESGPSTAKDFASLQHDWADHGYGSCLVDALKIGQSHAAAMTKYFDSAIELMSILGDSSRWRVGSERVEVDCACQSDRLYSPSRAHWEGVIPDDTGS